MSFLIANLVILMAPAATSYFRLPGSSDALFRGDGDQPGMTHPHPHPHTHQKPKKGILGYSSSLVTLEAHLVVNFLAAVACRCSHAHFFPDLITTLHLPASVDSSGRVTWQATNLPSMQCLQGKIRIGSIAGIPSGSMCRCGVHTPQPPEAGSTATNNPRAVHCHRVTRSCRLFQKQLRSQP